MNRQEIENKVRKIIVELLGVSASKVTLASAITSGGDPSTDLNADSLSVVELIMALEDVFNIDITDDEVLSLKTVKDVVDYLESHP